MEIDCGKCSDGTKALRGCEMDSTAGEWWQVGDYKLKRCPLKLLRNDGLEYLQAYRFYKQGNLPVTGGWLDQTQTFIEAVGLIDGEINKIEEKIRKNQKD